MIVFLHTQVTDAHVDCMAHQRATGTSRLPASSPERFRDEEQEETGVEPYCSAHEEKKNE
jgi:hypothetical protein